MLKVAVLCESSGTVRDAFNKLGHNATSYDLLPTESPGPHIQGDIRDADLTGNDIILAFPTCTYLCSSGLHWNKRVPGRDKLTEQAVEFVKWLWSLPCEKMAIENPVGRLSTAFLKPSQIIQPWMFGHPESKATCLWLRGLPNLRPTNVLSKPACGHWDNQTPSGQNKLGPSADRWKQRSKTYAGIAQAMAEQWTKR